VDGGVIKLSVGRPTTLSEEQEKELSDVLISMSNKLFGLSPKVVRELVYTYCETNGIEHRFNDNEKATRRDWLAGFLSRHRNHKL
jgi:hypothetical protein